MKVIFLITLLFSGSLSALAASGENCSTIDYRDEVGDPRDQGETGTCYSKTTSDLATQKLGFRVSDVGIAKSFLALEPERLKDHHDPEIKDFLSKDPQIIERIHEERNKEPERWHPENMLSYQTSKDEDGDTEVKYNGLFNTGGIEDGALIMANLDGFCSEEKLSASGDDDYVKLTQEAHSYAGRATANLPVDCPPVASTGQMTKTTNDLSKIIVKSFSNYVDQKCGHRTIPNPPLIPQTFAVAKDLNDYQKKLKSGELKLQKEQDKIFNEIDRNLERHRISAIGYDYQEHVGKEKGWDHSAIIAARKVINGQCRYFLRNSIGADCSDYSKEFQALPLCEKERGGIWVTRDDLKTVYSVISVK